MSHFCLLGHINDRTRNLSDHIIIDERLLNDLNIDEIVGNVVKPISDIVCEHPTSQYPVCQ